MKSPIAAAWEKYHTLLIPNIPTDSIQFKETKQAFYSGAIAFSTILETISQDNVSEESAHAVLTIVNKELGQYATVRLREQA